MNAKYLVLCLSSAVVVLGFLALALRYQSSVCGDPTLKDVTVSPNGGGTLTVTIDKDCPPREMEFFRKRYLMKHVYGIVQGVYSTAYK